MHSPSGYSLVTCCSFDKSKKEQNYYRGKDCMKMFCRDLKDQATKISLMKIKKFVIYAKKNLVLIKKTVKLEIIIIIQENIEELLIVFVI